MARLPHSIGSGTNHRNPVQDGPTTMGGRVQAYDPVARQLATDVARVLPSAVSRVRPRKATTLEDRPYRVTRRQPEPWEFTEDQRPPDAG